MSMHRVIGNDGQFSKLCKLIGAPELSSDPRFVTNPQRDAHRDALKRPLDGKLTPVDCEPLAYRPMGAGVPCAPIHDVPAALADPHTTHRAWWWRSVTSTAGWRRRSSCRGRRRRFGLH
jgi:crotonobetainyl-CoA:carnitine CoA-transferase CaiB-like acyl-CoA transferase